MRSVLVILMILLLGVGAARAEPLQLESPAAVIVDSTTGEELFTRAGDEPRPIASLTKIFVAMILREHHLDLAGWTQITAEDARAAEGGAGTRLLRGESFNNLDLLHAMLLVSDNRVPTALARSVKLSPRQLLAEMNHLAESLGLAHTRFTDVTGILGNESTAREMAIAMTKVLADPVLAKIMRTRYARITSKSEAVTIDYKSTVLPLWTKGLRIRGGKTGTTEAAGHCMLIGATVAKRPVVMAFLGGDTAESRFVDFAKAVQWLER